ncbi:MAG: alpha/beta hydrolase [Rhodospirillaceae bacterium]|nr:alpha/beta hydrolase [Rhodospirillaceae bacterium]
MRVRIEEVGGVPTRYYHEGSGLPLLLVHGVGVTADTWLRNIDPLAEDFSVYAPDLLDNGYSGQGNYTGGPPQPHMVAHLADFADHLGLDEFAVCGSSFGGLLAALLHLHMPERVTRLILLSSGTLFNSEEELARTLAESHANGSSAMDDPSWESCQRRMERIVHDPAAVPPEMIFAQLTLYAMPGQREAYERRMRGLMDIEACRPYRVAERLEEIAAPTLMIWGKDDPRAVMARAEDAAARIPDATLVVFERCKHHPHVEQAGRFNDLARRFLKGQALADAA